MLDLTLDLCFPIVATLACLLLVLCLAALCGRFAEPSEDLTDWSEE